MPVNAIDCQSLSGLASRDIPRGWSSPKPARRRTLAAYLAILDKHPINVLLARFQALIDGASSNDMRPFCSGMVLESVLKIRFI